IRLDVCLYARFLASPCSSHLQDVKQIFRYVHGTKVFVYDNLYKKKQFYLLLIIVLEDVPLFVIAIVLFILLKITNISLDHVELNINWQIFSQHIWILLLYVNGEKSITK
ncbi:hypothetical protein ACJX0J_031053, partial [Zea mays]